MLTDLFYVGVGLAAAGTDAVSKATITANTRAFIGARGTATLTADADRVVDVSGDIVVTAVSNESAKAKIEGGSGSLLLAIGILQPEASISGDVEAYAGQNARIEADNVVFSTAVYPEVTGSAVTTRRAETELITGQVGLLASGSDVGSKATINGNVDAFVAAGASIVVPGDVTGAGDVKVIAKSVSTAIATAKGGSGAIGISVSLYETTATIGGTSAVTDPNDPADTNGGTHVWVAGDAHVTAKNLTLTAHAAQTATADIPELAVVGLIGAGADPRSTAKILADTTAELRAGAVISTPTGATNVSATSDNEASASADGGAGSIGVAASTSTLNATVGDGTRSLTSASVGAGANVTAASLSLGALGEYTATTDMLLVSVGLLGGGAGANANSTVNAPTRVTATDAILSLSGNVSFESSSSSTATATLRGGAGGFGGAVFDGTATSSITGETVAYISGSSTEIDGADRVDVHATILGAAAKSKASVGTGAAFSMGKATANANSDPVARAYITGAALGDTTPVGTSTSSPSGAVRPMPRPGPPAAAPSPSGSPTRSATTTRPSRPTSAPAPRSPPPAT